MSLITKTVGIIGLGHFGRLLYSLIKPDFDLKVYDVSDVAHEDIVTKSSLEIVANCEIVFLCVPINHLESVLLELKNYIKIKNTIIDVSSVKVVPNELMERILPAYVNILPTHPMFGPNSAANGIDGLPFVLCPTSRTTDNILSFLSIYLNSLGFKVIQMTCDEHDRVTAYSLCVTQLIGRALGELELQTSPSDTQAFQNLFNIREIALNDTYELFYNLQTKNSYAKEMRNNFLHSLQKIEKELNSSPN